MPSVSVRLPRICATSDEDEGVFADPVGNSVVDVVVVVDGVVVVDAGVVVVPVLVLPPPPPSPEPPLFPPDAAAGPAVIAKNRMEVAASRRQPVTAIEYDKPTLSLSCAYGVSCRVRAERVCATPLSMWRFTPRAATCDSTTGSPAPAQRE